MSELERALRSSRPRARRSGGARSRAGRARAHRAASRLASGSTGALDRRCRGRRAGRARGDAGRFRTRARRSSASSRSEARGSSSSTSCRRVAGPPSSSSRSASRVTLEEAKPASGVPLRELENSRIACTSTSEARSGFSTGRRDARGCSSRSRRGSTSTGDPPQEAGRPRYEVEQVDVHGRPRFFLSGETHVVVLLDEFGDAHRGHRASRRQRLDLGRRRRRVPARGRLSTDEARQLAVASLPESSGRVASLRACSRPPCESSSSTSTRSKARSTSS